MVNSGSKNAKLFLTEPLFQSENERDSMQYNCPVKKNYGENFSDPIVWFFSLHLFDKITLLGGVFILLSPFGEHFLLKVNGRYVAEVGIIAVGFLLLFRWPSIIQKLKNIILKPINLPINLILIFLLILGTFAQGDFFSSYSDFRATFIMVVTYQYFVSSKTTLEQNKRFLYIVSLFALLLYICAFYIGIVGGISTKEIYPVLAVPLMMYLSSSNKWSFYLFIVAILIGFMISLRGFYRSNWIIYFFSILTFLPAILLSQDAIRNVAKLVLASLWIAVFAFLLIKYSYYITDYLFSTESRYIQIVSKSQGLLDFVFGRRRMIESDYSRYYSYLFVARYWWQFLFPSGLGHDYLIFNVHSLFSKSFWGNTVDSAFIYLAVHFGLILSAIMLARLSINLLKKLISSSSPLGFSCVVISVTILLMYGSICGSMFVNISMGFFAGSFAGIVLNPNDQWRCRSEGKDNKNLRCS